MTSYDQISAADIVMLDTAPDAAAKILGTRMPRRIRRAYRRYSYGPAAYKVDYAIEGDIAWHNRDVGRAGTVHLGGSLEQIVDVEAQTVRGQMPVQPFVLLGQQYRLFRRCDRRHHGTDRALRSGLLRSH